MSARRGYTLPDDYCLTPLFLALRACQRFRLSPFGDWRGWDGLTPPQQRLMLAFDSVSRAMEARG